MVQADLAGPQEQTRTLRCVEQKIAIPAYPGDKWTSFIVEGTQD